MARLNISITDELKDRMTGLNVNWSALAQEAFAAAVAVEELRGKGKDIEAGLARLRADKHRHAEREQAEGFRCGAYWALEEASYDELAAAAAVARAVSEPAEAKAWVERHLDATGFDLPDMPPTTANVSAPWALGYLQGAADVFAKV